ncbi:CPSF A subunit region-domain-containing protein [Melanogaster broomeanus]|nr:CPSF A subunit region-domain-containing protein [Melanogaster broomeanus]
MKLVATFHPPSSVLDSLKCTLADELGSEFLIVAKLNRVDIYSVQPEGLSHEQGIEIWGRIRAVKSVPIVRTNRLSLLVLTDHPEPELVFLSFTVNKSGDTDLRSTKHLSLFERNARSAEFCHDVLVDPSGAIAVVSVYTGRLKVVILNEEGSYDRDFDASVVELNLLTMLHYDFQQRLQLLARDVTIDDLQLSPAPSPLLPPVPPPGKWFSIEEQTPRLIFVPSVESSGDDFEGGVLIVGGRKILLYDLASRDVLEQNIRRNRRTEKKKRSGDAEEASRAKDKEMEREWRKKKTRAMITWPWSEVTALCSLNQENNKLLIGDKYGRLALLCVDGASRMALTLIALGEASSPTTLTYLTNQVVYLGSHFGDSQLLRISSSPVSNLNSPTVPVPTSIPTIKPAELCIPAKTVAEENAEGTIVNGLGSYVVELENFTNLAPIVDGILVDTDNSGQNEIVTCSGGRNTGSLKVVRSGADFREASVVHGISNVNRIWPVRESYRDRKSTHIVLSTLHETHVFRFDDERGTVVSSVGSHNSFMTSCRTLAVSNILRRIPKDGSTGSAYKDSSLVVQVVPEGLLLLNYDRDMRMYTRIGGLWTLDRFADGDVRGWAGREIVAADINASQVVIALNYGRLVLLNLDGDRFVKRRQREFVESAPHSCTAEISAVTCRPLDDSKAFAIYIAVAFWTSKIVKILSLISEPGTMKVVCETKELPAVPRSLLLHNFTSETGELPHHHLLVGLTNGSVTSFPFNNERFGDQKFFPIGTFPVTMHSCRIKDRSAVFACGSRTSILFWEKERLQHSPLMLKDVSAAADFSTTAYPSSVVLASPDALVIGSVANFDKLHIRSVPLGYDSPRRIVHNPSWGAFAVSCLRPMPAQIGEAEMFSSSVQLFHDVSFEKLTELEVDQGEEVTSLHSFTVTLSGVPMSFVCAGVTSSDDREREPSQGRLILLQANSSRTSLIVMASVNVRGCVYALTSIDGTIIAAVNSSVGIIHICKPAVFNHNYLITTLVSRDNKLLVGDALTSVSLLKLNGSQIEPVAKDYGSLWPTCAEMFDDNTIIGGNSDYNLFAFRLQQTELNRLLEREGHYYLGDIVNKFLPGTLSSHDISVDVPMMPKQLFLTAAGQIGVVIDLNDDQLSLDMTALQRNLSTFYENKAGISQSKFRAPKNNSGRSDLETTSVGFLDGDFLERFLQFMVDQQSLSQIMEGQTEPERLTISADQIQKVLEGLQSMH